MRFCAASVQRVAYGLYNYIPTQYEKIFFMKKYLSINSEYNKRMYTLMLCERPSERHIYDVDHVGYVLCCLILEEV